MSYLDAEGLIIEHLKGTITLVPENKILSAADMEGVLEKSQANPAIQVILLDDQPESNQKGELNSQLVGQLWQVVVVVRNVKEKSGSAARKQAGGIIEQTIKALNGKHFKHPYGRMERIKSPYRPTYRGGFFYFPLLFKVRMRTTGSESYSRPL